MIELYQRDMNQEYQVICENVKSLSEQIGNLCWAANKLGYNSSHCFLINVLNYDISTKLINSERKQIQDACAV